jgi:hypothetical protein
VTGVLALSNRCRAALALGIWLALLLSGIVLIART